LNETEWETAMKNPTLFLALSALAAFAACTVARADSVPDRLSVTVHFEDLDLTNVQGAAMLYGRIKNAARNVCRPLEPGPSLELLRPYAACMNQALTHAVAYVNRPTVTAYAAAQADAPFATRIARID
jgi:UrcA family protein